MFKAIIWYGTCRGKAELGPTDTRDEASRLARAWLDAHRPRETNQSNQVYGVDIVPADAGD